MLLTPEELASELNVSNRQLQKWRFNDEGPRFIRLNSKTVRYRREDVDQWLADLAAAFEARTEGGQ
jgi:excisionase family DNA binding protein